jgi:NADPH:quinone reductase-like Zn-dependent oxidoreductase
MMKALQAAIVDGSHKLTLKNVPKPSIEKPNQILVKVIAAAVNPSDIINSKGTRTLNLLPQLYLRWHLREEKLII